MTFGERARLDAEYRKWLQEKNTLFTAQVADTFMNALVFLEEKGLLKTGGDDK